MARTVLGGPKGVAGWSLRLRIFLFFSLIACGGAASALAAAYLSWRRFDPTTPEEAFVFGAVIASFCVMAITTWVWFLFDLNVAKPLIALAGDLRSRAHANVRDAIDSGQGRYLGDLAPAASAVSLHLAESRSGLDAAIERERERILSEHLRLDAILRDAPMGCVLCSREHRVALYNKRAVESIDALGLGRSLLTILRAEPIEDALARLAQRNDAAATDLLCTTLDGSHTFQAQIRLFAGDAETGYLLTFRDVTDELASHSQREMLLRDVFDSLQRPSANLLTTIEALRTPDSAVPEIRTRLQAAVVAETHAMAQSVAKLRARYEDAGAGWWPMSDAPAGDILTSVQTRLAQSGIEAALEAEPIAIRCDGFAIARLLGDLALEVAARIDAKTIALSAVRSDDEALLDISWRGDAYPIGALERRLDEPLSAGLPGLTARDCLRSHGTDVWPETTPPGDARLRMPLPLAAPADGVDPAAARSVFHDLSLLSDPANVADPKLRDLSCVVFDTETTGLHPERGDELVQIAAVRLVRGRPLIDDRFDTLVDPGRPISQASTAIHGIDAAMVAGAPSPAEAVRRFHQYRGDGALIAHNAPFDLAFLKRHDGLGDALALDTILMSAILFGRAAEHNLDAVAERLGSEIDPAVRHTALGDAIATADIAAKAIPMLEAIGVVTLSDYERAATPHRDLVATFMNA